MTLTKSKHQYKLAILIFTILLLLSFVSSINARQFRSIAPIASSDRNDIAPEGTIPVENIEPIAREDIEPLVKDMIEKWNTSEMSSILSEQFYDKSRLIDAVDTAVPRDAKLRVQSIQGIQTLGQFLKPGQGNERSELISIVSATVRTQLEFNNSSGTFVNRSGTNEFILQVTTAAPPQ